MMALFQRNKQTIGLDIGSGFIKAAVVDHSGDEPRLSRIASLPLVSDAIVEGEIMDPPLVVDTIQAVVQTLGTKARSVVTAVGGRDVIVKKIQMDRMPESDAREVIRWEAEQYVPFEMENVQLDFQILDPLAEGLQMEVLLVAAKRDLVDQRMMLLADAGLQAAVVDVDAFALFNAFEYNYPSASRGVGALANVGHEVTTVIVYEDGVPLVTRDVQFGSKQVKEDLRRLHGLSSEEAEEIVQGQTKSSADADKLLYERGAELALAVERATAFLTMDGSGGTGIQAVNMSGGGARMPRLQDAISDRLRVRIEVLNPFQRLEVGPDALADLPGEETASMWMLPVGLALRGPV
ncbi:MAG: type IV pilus assembly protein PilM [Gemmatimonadota bacterium]